MGKWKPVEHWDPLDQSYCISGFQVQLEILPKKKNKTEPGVVEHAINLSTGR